MAHSHAVTDLATLREVSTLRRGTQVELNLPSLPDSETRAVQDRFNRLVSACECAASAAFLVVTVLACGIFDAAYWSVVEAHPFKALSINLLACAIGTGAGKATMVHARRSLARLIRKTEQQLAKRAAGDGSQTAEFKEGKSHVDLHQRLQSNHATVPAAPRAGLWPGAAHRERKTKVTVSATAGDGSPGSATRGFGSPTLYVWYGRGYPISSAWYGLPSPFLFVFYGTSFRPLFVLSLRPSQAFYRRSWTPLPWWFSFSSAIPILGRLLNWIWDVVVSIVWLVAGLVDTVAGLLGIRPEKRLYLVVINQRDERGNPIATSADLLAAIALAIKVYRDDANVRILPFKLFDYTTPAAGDEQASEDYIVNLSMNGTAETLDVNCGASDFAADLGFAGAQFQNILALSSFWSGWRQVAGLYR